MSDIVHKRAFVASLYPGEGWKRRVKHMPDEQVVAIYLREQNKLNEHKPSEKESGDDGIPF